MRWWQVMTLIVGLAACQLGCGGKTAPKDVAAPNAIMGDAIEVTSLDAAPVKEGAAKPAPGAPAAAGKPPATAPGPDAPLSPLAPVKPAEAAIPPPPEAEAPPVIRTPSQIACEKKGGRWTKAGKSGAMTCVTPTGEGTRQCSRQTDCEGLCLARSGTCAPFMPIFGCNEILQADGSATTLCLD